MSEYPYMVYTQRYTERYKVNALIYNMYYVYSCTRFGDETELLETFTEWKPFSC
jgi:hypothetical protein